MNGGAVMLVIGIAGGSATGKTTVAKIIAKRLGENISIVKLSDILRECYKDPESCPVEVEKNDNPTKKELAELGNKLRQKFCDGILVKMAVEKHADEPLSVIIIEGIRTLGEASQLLTLDPKKFKPVLIYVTANKNTRKERWRKRGTVGNFEEIYKLERGVWKTHLIRKIADYVIVNNEDSIPKLEVEVENAMDVVRRKFPERI